MPEVKTIKTGFKVVQTDGVDGHYKSATILGLTVAYKLLMTTSRRPYVHGPFALFSTLSNALDFCCEMRAESHDIYDVKVNFKVLLCEYVEARERCLWFRQHEFYTHRLSSYPPGTVFADTVTPLCEANDHDPDSLTLKNLKDEGVKSDGS
jgi:hypothetical protein